jgi:pilus assembly protein CpaC
MKARIASTLLPLAALAAPLALASAPTAASAQTVTSPARSIAISIGRGQLVTLPGRMTDVFVANDTIADVQVKSTNQLYVFGKSGGETTVYASNANGDVVWSANIRVGSNIDSIEQMLKLAMPEAKIITSTMNNTVLLTGTLAAPEDAAEAERLVKAFVDNKTNVISRLKMATPLQVNLHVKFAEVNRSLSKEIAANLTTRDRGSGFNVGVIQGRDFGTIGNVDTSTFPKLDASAIYGFPTGTISLPFNPATGQFITQAGSELAFKGLGAGTTTLGFLGSLFGLDVGAAFDLSEKNGLVSTLAEPNLTALSGETASFLAGGEFPIPVSQSLGTVAIEYRQYGVSLAFTPTVLADGRISMRVRPEVSQLSSEGSVTLNGFSVPAFITRRSETTVELGSGQSFMIGGLIQNSNINSIDRVPGLGDVPVLGAMFRSNGYRRNQTELMIIVTPYLVKPVSANEIKLPTDGFNTPTDLQNFLMGQDFSGKTGAKRDAPTLAPPVTVPARPTVGDVTIPAPLPRSTARTSQASATPGFSN